MKIPFTAVLLTPSRFCSPRYRDSREFTPTPVPTATPISRFCTEYASETAVSACSLILATNRLSTILYMAWIIMDIIIGSAMVTSRRLTGMTPILFSPSVRVCFSICLMFSSFKRLMNPPNQNLSNRNPPIHFPSVLLWFHRPCPTWPPRLPHPCQYGRPWNSVR